MATTFKSKLTSPSILGSLPFLWIIFFCCLSVNSAAQFNKPASSDTAKKVTFAAIPIINYNSTFGFMGGAMGAMYYKLNKQDTISPSSSTMLFGMYSTSKTYFAMGLQQMYFNEDKWRAKFGIGRGDIFFQYFQGLPSMGNFGAYNEDGIWVDFKTTMNFLLLEVSRLVIKDLYVGVETMINKANTDYDITNPATGENFTSTAQMNSVGYTLLYDSRNNVNNPTKGFFIQYKNRFVREAFGASENFNRFEIAANNFWDIGNNHKSILVSRVFANISAGDVPFEGENVVGRDDIRGYSEGKYRGNQVYTIQAEWRQKVYKKLGMVGFLGVASAVNQINEIPKSELLPGGGVGIRYLMIPGEKINVGFDVGVGKEDWSLTFRIGETFGR